MVRWGSAPIYRPSVHQDARRDRPFAIPRSFAVQPNNFHRSVDGDASSLPNDETLVAPQPHASHPDSSSLRMRESIRRQVAIVEGSTPHLSSETRDVLRSRLRIAAVLFFVTFLAFLA